MSVVVDLGPEFRHLEYFLAVAEEKKFSRAARRLHLTQPSLSRQIQQLEGFVGASLLARTQTGVVLTPAGITFLSHARTILRMRREAIDHTSLVGSGIESPLRFGFSPWVAPEFVQEVFAGYRGLIPSGVLEATSRGSGPLIRMILDGRLRAALVHLPAKAPGLYVQPVCDEKLVLCMRANDPLASEATIAASMVADRLRIMFAPELHPALYDSIERRLTRAHIRLRPREFVLHPSEMQLLVKESAGWALMREHTVLDPALALRPIAGVTVKLRSALICLQLTERPVIPLLSFRVANFCLARDAERSQRKPVARVPPPMFTQQRLFG